MNLKFNKKNYKSNLVEFSETSKIYFLLFFIFFNNNIIYIINFCLYKNVSFYYSEKY